LIAYAVPVSGFLRGSGFAGLPATVMPSGMSHTITAPAPIQLPSFPNGVENVGRKAVYAP
ncbi:TPA: hypothetical protein ACLA4J_001362, partial [Neisseria meningitidis]